MKKIILPIYASIALMYSQTQANLDNILGNSSTNSINTTNQIISHRSGAKENKTQKLASKTLSKKTAQPKAKNKKIEAKTINQSQDTTNQKMQNAPTVQKVEVPTGWEELNNNGPDKNTDVDKIIGIVDTNNTPKIIYSQITLQEINIIEKYNVPRSGLINWQKLLKTKKGKDSLIVESAQVEIPKQITFSKIPSLESCLNYDASKIAYRSIKEKPVMIQNGDYFDSYRGTNVKDLSFSKGNSNYLVYSFIDTDGKRKIMLVDYSLEKNNETILFSSLHDISNPTVFNKKVVFQEDNDLFVYDMETKGAGSISKEFKKERKPKFINDLLFFVSNFEGKEGDNIYTIKLSELMDKNNKNKKYFNITNNDQRILDYDANSNFVAVAAIENQNQSEGYIIDLQNKTKIMLGKDFSEITSISISDDNKVVFSNGKENDSKVYLFDLNTKKALRIGEGFFASIAKNGSKITYTRLDNGTKQIMTYSVPSDISEYKINKDERVTSYIMSNSKGIRKLRMYFEGLSGPEERFY